MTMFDCWLICSIICSITILISPVLLKWQIQIPKDFSGFLMKKSDLL